MRRQKLLSWVLLFCLAGLIVVAAISVKRMNHAVSASALSGIQAGDSQGSPLRAEIKLAKASIKSREELSVATALQNSGPVDWSLEELACGGSNRWVSDNPSVLVVPEACTSNAFRWVAIKPGQAYESAVPVRVEVPALKDRPESVAFRLGFKDPTFSANPRSRPIWSNSITVNITR